MRLPRFRLRTLMIAVAVAGLDLAYLAWAKRSSRANHCGNPLAEWMTVQVLLTAITVRFAVRQIGRSQ
jgi:hypothetical protein